jgi:hypothetical protein
MARVKNGKFIESWNNWDTLGLMQQLGGNQRPRCISQSVQ